MSLPVANAQTHQVMAGWSSGKPVAALMGEFSSGKSTLLNFLLGEEVATTKVTATPLPPIWFTHSETEFVTALREDGSEVEVELGDPAINYRETYLAIRVGHPSDALKTCDIIDTPGLSDPDLPKDALRFLHRYFSFAIWCTAAAQAWRQTEKAAYEKLAARTKENSILVITRADKLRYAKDEAKVFKRVHGETHEMFGEVVVLKTPKAAEVAEADRTDAEDGAWVETGGFGFFKCLDAAIKASASGTRKPQKPQNTAQKVEAKPKKAEAKPKPPVASTEQLEIPSTEKTMRAASERLEPRKEIDSSVKHEAAAPAETKHAKKKKEDAMSSTDISNLAQITGFMGACLVDTETGLMMASEGGENIDLEMAGAANAEVVKAKLNAMKMLEIDRKSVV